MSTQKQTKKSEDRPKPDAQQKAKPAAAGKDTKSNTSTKEAKFENPKDDPAWRCINQSGSRIIPPSNGCISFPSEHEKWLNASAETAEKY